MPSRIDSSSLWKLDLWNSTKPSNNFFSLEVGLVKVSISLACNLSEKDLRISSYQLYSTDPLSNATRPYTTVQIYSSALNFYFLKKIGAYERSFF